MDFRSYLLKGCSRLSVRLDPVPILGVAGAATVQERERIELSTRRGVLEQLSSIPR